MSRKNRANLAERVVKTAETTLATEDAVCAIDVLRGIGWLDASALDAWRQGRVDCVEAAIQTNPVRLVEALEIFQRWAAGQGLVASETDYVARTPQRQALRFSRAGDPAVERLFRTHWTSPEIPDKRRERLAEKASRAPELVVVQPLNREWTCHRCGGTGDLLIMENAGPACLGCAGLGDLEFLGSGDALLTRRAKARSGRYAVVVRFSRTRRRYERQGLMVEPHALKEAERELGREPE
ncbi:MAG TPA: hypothetical protein VFE63_13990 [Roseiarcus sp.]|jgi:hypothetical protein|nr:hypothetical protein [Roseiarcus sp.]